MKTLILTLMLTISGCAGQTVRQIETDVESRHGFVQGSLIAVDKDGQAIIQKETDAEVELREQKWKNADLEGTVHSKHESLTRCRKELADPRLGGNGAVPEVPELDVTKNLGQQKEQFGLTERGELKIVKRENYLDRLKAERKFEEILKATDKMLMKYADKCDNDMRLARVKAGLPGERYQGVGYFYGGGRFQSQRRAEQNLDDAFQFLAEDKAKTAQREE